MKILIVGGASAAARARRIVLDLTSYLRLILRDEFLLSSGVWLILVKICFYNFFRRNMWEGIYSSRDAVPVNSRDEFQSRQWLVPLYLSTKKIKDDLEKDRPISGRWMHVQLGGLAASLASSDSGVRILDVGGGMGGAYLYLLSSGIPAAKVRYHVVEKQPIVDMGRKLLASYEGISFHTSLNDTFSGVDVLYVSTAAQYFDDMSHFFSRANTIGPKFILFNQLLAGEIPTFWSLQKYGDGIPYRFFRFSEFVAPLKDGFDLIFHEKNSNKYSMDNFSQEYRLQTISHALFKQKQA